MKLNLHKILSLFVMFVIGLCAFTACGAAPADPQPAQEPEPVQEPVPEPVSLQLSLDEWPVIDGATAFLPYYRGMASLLLGMSEEEAGKYVLCNTTDFAYPNLVEGKCDMVFCLRPSKDQVEYAKTKGVAFEEVHVLNEGFVFFVNQNNPVDSLTVQQLHDIYAGKITNWKEVGGNDEEIIAYQRSEGSGSQTGLYLHVIGEDEIMEPPTALRIGTMGEIVDAVADYDNAASAIGFSYYYFVTNQHFEDEIKLLKIEGTAPGMDTISSGEYPMISETCAVFRADEPEDSVVRRIAGWCISPQGQQLGIDRGYVPVQ